MHRTVKHAGYWLVALTTLTMALAMTACAPGTEAPPSPEPPAPGAAQPSPGAGQPAGAAQPASQPKRGGIFVVMADATSQGADYHSTSSIGMIEAFSNIHASILELSPDDRVTVRGYLATSWQASADGTTFTFKIREGLKTHKGKPFNAEDVAYSVYRMVERPGKVTGARSGCLRAVVKRATAPDPTTVVIELKAPAASFIPCMTNPYLAIQPKYVVETVDRENRIMQPEEIDGVGA
ncbi:MAG: hypothetical protein HY689_07715, partial [Chloroflexi bacterium]|nr:hypothetical protein [Chloroflexota bacterium]